MKRFRKYWIILTAFFIICSGPVRADGKIIEILQEKEWTWEENSAATFEGSVSLDGLPEGKLLLRLSFTTDPKASDPGQVVFHTVNGTKLTLRKQKPEYVFDPEGQETLQFAGNWKTPDSVFFTKVDILFQVCTEDGSRVLDEKRLTVSRSASEIIEKDDGRFRLRVDFSGWTRYAAIAAGAVWILAAVRLILNRNKKKKER